MYWFFNGYHVDKNEVLNHEMLIVLMKTMSDELDLLQSKTQHEQCTVFKKELSATIHALEYVKCFNIGISTTCGYMFIDKNNNIRETEFNAYFLLNDYRISISLQHKLYHNFNAYMFGHQTSLPSIKKMVVFITIGMGLKF